MSLRAGDSLGVQLIRNGQMIKEYRANDPDYGVVAERPEVSGERVDDKQRPITTGGPHLLHNAMQQNPNVHPDTQKLLDQGFKMSGRWSYELWRPISKRPGAPLRPVLIGETPNLIVDGGKLSILDVYFNSATQIVQTSWFAGAISSASYTSIVAADTMGSHTGWTEFTNYSAGTRPTWGPGSPTNTGGVAITNASPITFNMTASGTVKGLFIVSNSTKGGTTGTLWAAALFVGGDVPVVNGDELRSTYTVNM